jgi:hypothetical protein
MLWTFNKICWINYEHQVTCIKLLFHPCFLGRWNKIIIKSYYHRLHKLKWSLHAQPVATLRPATTVENYRSHGFGERSCPSSVPSTLKNASVLPSILVYSTTQNWPRWVIWVARKFHIPYSDLLTALEMRGWMLLRMSEWRTDWYCCILQI